MIRMTSCATLLAVMVAACGGGSSANSVSRTDSAGVSIVVNHGPDHPLHWTFTPVLTLGGKDEGPESFFHVYPGYVTTDAGGNIYLIDYDNHRLVAFDSAGHTLWTAGREGKGPGEFTYPQDIVLGPHERDLRVFDPGNAVFDRFSLDGTFLGAERITHGFNERMEHVGDAMALEVGHFGRDAADNYHDLTLVTANDSTTIASVTGVLPKPVQFPHCSIGMMMAPIFTPELHWAARRDRLIVNGWVPFTLAVYRGDTLVASVRRALEPVTATAELAGMHFPHGFAVSAGETKCKMSGEEAAELMGFAPVIPFVSNLAIGPDGAIWVQRHVTAERTKPTDIFDSTGTYLGSLPDSTPWPFAFMPNGDVVSAKTDTATDVTRLVVYRVRK